MLTPKQNYFTQNKELIVSLAVASACLALTILFPVNNSLQGYTKYVVFLAVIPALFIRFVLKQNLSRFGLKLGHIPTGLFWSLSGIILSLVSLYLLFNYTSFRTNYYSFSLTAPSFAAFLFSELIFVNILLFLYNAFFRGFLLFTLLPFIGYWAVIAETLAYAVTTWFSGNSWHLVAPQIILSFIGGLVTIKSRSFIYAYFMSLVVIILLDAFFIRQLSLN